MRDKISLKVFIFQYLIKLIQSYIRFYIWRFCIDNRVLCKLISFQIHLVFRVWSSGFHSDAWLMRHDSANLKISLKAVIKKSVTIRYDFHYCHHSKSSVIICFHDVLVWTWIQGHSRSHLFSFRFTRLTLVLTHQHPLFYWLSK